MSETVIVPLIRHQSTDREAWLTARKNFITATDWPKIAGKSKYGTGADVLAEKKGLAPEVVENTAMRVGKLIEAHIIAHLIEVGNLKQVYGGLDLLSRGHAACTPDLTAMNPHGHLVHHEIKTSARLWRGNPPAHYEEQVKEQLAVLDMNDGWLVSYPVEDAEAEMLELELGTWKLDPAKLRWQQISTTASERAEILAEIESWWDKHMELGLPIEQTQTKANWDGTYMDPELAAQLKQAEEMVKAIEENLEAAKGMRDNIREKAAAAMADAKILQGYGFAYERIAVAGRKSTEYPKVIAAVEKFLPEEGQKALAEAMEIHTKTTKPSVRWALSKENAG